MGLLVRLRQVLSLADLVEGSRRLLRVLGEKEGTKPSKGADDEARLRLRKPGQKNEDEMEVDGDAESRVMDLRYGTGFPELAISSTCC